MSNGLLTIMTRFCMQRIMHNFGCGREIVSCDDRGRRLSARSCLWPIRRGKRVDTNMIADRDEEFEGCKRAVGDQDIIAVSGSQRL
jgi:hypothetical protein